MALLVFVQKATKSDSDVSTDTWAVPDLVTIHPILPPTVHLHPCILLASSTLLVEVYSSF